MTHYRKFFTSATGFTFLIVAGTGVILKFFLKNHPLEEIHTWIGLGMVAVAAFHISQNWHSLKHHLQDVKVLSLLIPILAVMAFFVFEPKQEAKGPNPRAVVKLLNTAAVKDVAKVFGKDPNEVLGRMKNAGIVGVNAGDSLDQIAAQSQKSTGVILGFFVE